MINKKNYLILIIGIIAFLSCFFISSVLASGKNILPERQKCALSGYTILTINGIFTDRKGAIKIKDDLKRHLPSFFNDQPITVDYLLNPSHLGGVGDILDCIHQGFFDNEDVTDLDLKKILISASEKLKTQKLLLVAHSQGNFYANSFYGKVADNKGGIPKQSIKIYSVATPSSFVAGQGKYITSDTDKVIEKVRRINFTKKVLPPNVHIEIKKGDDPLGHSFSDIYLKYQGKRMLSDIKTLLSQLKTNNIQTSQELCLSPIKLTWVDKVEEGIYLVSDSLMDLAENTGIMMGKASLAQMHLQYKLISYLAKKAASTISKAKSLIFQSLNIPQWEYVGEINTYEQEKKEEKVLLQAQVSQIQEEEEEDKNQPQDSQFKEVPLQENQYKETEFHKAKETKQEQIEKEKEKEQKPEQEKQPENKQQEKQKQNKKEISTCSLANYQTSSYKGKVIFNEIAWMGTTNSSYDEWIELKNTTNNNIDITNWQILNKSQKLKINLSTYEVDRLGIPGQGFFLLERTDDTSVPNITADFIYKGTIKNSNESLYLFDSNCHLVDKVEGNPKWPAGDNKQKKTMERNTTDLTWHTSSKVNGTPKQENTSLSLSLSLSLLPFLLAEEGAAAVLLNP